MADVSKSVEIIFGAVDKTSGGIASVGRGLKELEGAVGGITGPLDSVATSIRHLDAVLLALGAAMIGFSINEAGKFEGSLNEIYTLLDASPEAFGKFEGGIKEYAANSTQSIEAINGAVYSAISAGYDYNTVLDTMAQSEQLAVAGKADLNSTTVLLASTMNAYGASAEDAQRYSDALFQTVKLGQTTLPELGARLALVTGIASSAGVPIETLTAAIADLTAKGLPTAQAITGIKAAISNIIKPTKDAADAAKELGVDFNATALETKGFEVLMQELYDATGGNTEQMARFFGSIEGLNAALVLSKGGAADFIDKLEQMKDSAGSTAEAYEKMANNFDLINQRVVNNMRLSMIEVGVKMLDQYKETALALGDLFKGVTVSVEDGMFDPVFNVLNQFGVDMEGWLSAVGENLPAALEKVNWDGFTRAMEDLGASIGGLFEGLDVTTPKGLSEAIQFVVDSGESLIDTTTGMVNAFKQFFDTVIKPAIDGFNDLDEETKKNAGSVLQWATNIEAILPVVGGVGSALESLAFAIGALSFTNFIGGASGAAVAVKALGGAAATAVGFLGTAGLVGAAGVAGYAVGTVLKDGVNAVVNAVTDSEQTLGTWLYDFIHGTDAGTESLQEFESVVDSTKGSVEDLADAASKSATAIKDTADGTEEAVEKTRDYDKEVNDLAASQNLMTDVQRKVNAVFAEHGKVLDVTTGKVTDIKDATSKAADSNEKWIDVLIGGVPTMVKVTETVTKTGEVVDAQAAAMEKAAKGSEEFRAKMKELEVDLEKIASNERIKTMEFAVKIKVAEIEADAKKVSAAFDSIGVTISATTELLGGMFDIWSKAGSLREKWQMEDWIEQQLEIQRDALDKQNELIDAQIENMNAQTNALERGDPFVTIQADGLEPELEAFMHRILDKLQIQMAAEYAQFLIGSGETEE